MLDLGDAVQDLIDHHAGSTPSIEAVSAQARFIRRRRRATGVAVGVMMAVLVAALIYPLTHSPKSEKVNVTGPSPTTQSSPPTTVHYISADSAKVVTPVGWIRVDFNNASIAAPANWTLDKYEMCPNPKYAVLIGAGAQSGQGCGPQFPLGPPMVSYVRLLPLPGIIPKGATVYINGHTGVEVADGAQTDTYYFPDLGLEIVAYGPDAAHVIPTVGWSSSYLLLHSTGPITVPPDWVTFTAEGVSIKVPPTWPQKHLGPTDPMPGVCANPYFTTPVAEQGEGGSTTCNGFSPYAPVTAVDGIWITAYPSQAQPFNPYTSTEVKSRPIAVYLLPPDNKGQPVAQLVAVQPNGAMTAIYLGLGSNPLISQEVLASIR